MKTRLIVKVTPLLLLSLAMGAGCRSAVAGNPEDAAPVSVTLARVHAAELPASFEAGGIVRARTTALVASRIVAPVAAVHVRAGDRVRRGSLLVTLDGRELTANQTRAEATLDGSVEAIGAAEGAVRSAEATLTLARADHTRLQTLHEQRSATTRERDQAAAAREAAEGQLQSARAALSAAIAAREAAVAGRDAASAIASYTALHAPFDGVIASRRVDPGDMTTPGAPLLMIEDVGALRLEATLDEARAALVVPGQTVEVALNDNGSLSTWTPSVVTEIARLDPAAHSFLVKIDLPSAVMARSGGFGRARFAGPSRSTLVVPAASAIRRGQLTFVFVVDADDRARLQPISPGVLVGDTLEVLAGLNDGDHVVVAPPASLSEGTRVSEARP